MAEMIAETKERGLKVASSKPRRSLAWRLWYDRVAVVAATILVVAALVALLAPWIEGHDPMRGRLQDRFLPPMWLPGGSSDHILGTDQLGRDIWSRMAHGARISLMVGVATVLGSGTLGVLAGLLSGYYKGWVDALIMRIVDIQQSFPFLALAIAVVAVLGPGILNTILVLGIAGWVLYARVVRGEVLSVREKEYVEAARTIGCSDWHIMVRHILPNVMAPVIIIGTFSFAYMVIAEASLSFLGLGVPAGLPTWGGMLSDSRNYMRQAWWLATFPGVALMLTVLGANLLGDWLRDRWDPRLKGQE